MFRRLRSLLFVLAAAVIGAVLGRIAFRARERMEAGESPFDIDPATVQMRPQDFIPGLVAAFRVKDAPWSWFHIPAWLAAFAVNFGVGALGGDLARLKAQAERTVFAFAGLDARDLGFGDYEDAGFVATGTVETTTRVEGTTVEGYRDGTPATEPPSAPLSWPTPPPNPTGV